MICVVEIYNREIAVADEATIVCAERKAIPQEPEADGAERRVEQVLEQDISGVLRLNDADLEHGEATLHVEDQRAYSHAQPSNRSVHT